MCGVLKRGRLGAGWSKVKQLSGLAKMSFCDKGRAGAGQFSVYKQKLKKPLATHRHDTEDIAGEEGKGCVTWR